MIKKALNRLWVRISLSIIALIFLITILPSASLLLTEPRDLINDSEAYYEQLNQDAGLGLSALQIKALAQDFAYGIQEDYVTDIQFLTLTSLIVGVLAGVLLGRGLSLPIERLAKATKAVASQELTHRVEVKGAQEITDLADNFNQMTTSLERSEQLRRNMMADVSHELLTPLTVMQGNLRAILDDVYDLNKDEIGKLYEQNKHLIRLVRDLRQLGQAEAGQLSLNMVSIDINDLVTETTIIFSPLVAEKNVAIVRELADALPHIQGDADRLRQVLHNLIANALRHTPEEGQITVSTALGGDEIQLTISDTGEGITPELQSQVFDRFYRTEEIRRRDSGGAGLGLAISKAIVLAHDGRITATSLGRGQGTTFAIFLPIYLITN